MVKKLPANAEDTGDVDSILGQEDLLEEEMAPTPVFLPGESHRQRSLVGYSPWGHKESNMIGRHSTNAYNIVKHLININFYYETPTHTFYLNKSDIIDL